MVFPISRGALLMVNSEQIRNKVFPCFLSGALVSPYCSAEMLCPSYQCFLLGYTDMGSKAREYNDLCPLPGCAYYGSDNVPFTISSAGSILTFHYLQTFKVNWEYSFMDNQKKLSNTCDKQYYSF